MSSQRWVCGGCGANNHGQASFCPRCGGNRALTASNVPTVQMTQNRRQLSSKLPPWWAILAVVIGIAFTCIAIPVITLTEAQQGASRRNAADSQPFRVHRSDLRGIDPKTKLWHVRCRVCGGSGSATHFGHSGDGKSVSDYHKDGTVACPFCTMGGAAFPVIRPGVVSEASLGAIKIVPDTEKSDY